MSHSSIADVVGVSPSRPDTAGLMGATLRAPIASSSEMLGSIGATFDPDVLVDVETGYDFTLEAGSEVQPTQPPHPPLVVDMPSGYPEDYGTLGTPVTADTVDIFGVDVTPLASISVSSVDATFYPDLSVDANISATSGTLREIRNPSQKCLYYCHFHCPLKTNFITAILFTKHWLMIIERVEYTTTKPPYLHHLITLQYLRSTGSLSLVTLTHPPTSPFL